MCVVDLVPHAACSTITKHLILSCNNEPKIAHPNSWDLFCEAYKPRHILLEWAMKGGYECYHCSEARKAAEKARAEGKGSVNGGMVKAAGKENQAVMS